MIVKWNSRFAMMIVAGSLLCVAAPLRAAEEDAVATTEQTASGGKPVALNKYKKHRRSASKRVVQPRKARVVAKGYRRKAAEAKALPMSDTDQAAIPDNVANANAQWPAAQATTASAAPASGDTAPAGVAPDQVSDLDRRINGTPAAGSDPASQIATQVASQVAANDQRTAPQVITTTAVAADAPVVEKHDDSSWGQASLIGKIFIAFGGLLTLASAARMFIA